MTDRADFRRALWRHALLAAKSPFFFVAPFVVLLAAATIPVTLLESRLVARGSSLAGAFLAALGAWLYVWVAIVACRFQVVYTAEALGGGGFGAGLERLGLELRWILQDGPPDGTSPRVLGPRMLAAAYVARVPMFWAPPIGCRPSRTSSPA